MAELHTAAMRAEARELIATAEARGFVRPAALNFDHIANPCDDCLFADADEARDYLAKRDQVDDDQPDPERCPDCDALQLCDCLIYPAAYGRIYPEYLP